MNAWRTTEVVLTVQHVRRMWVKDACASVLTASSATNVKLVQFLSTFRNVFRDPAVVIVCLVSENECMTQEPCVNGACIENSDGSFDRCNCTSTNMKGANCELRKPRKSTLSNVINIFYLLSLFPFSAVLWGEHLFEWWDMFWGVCHVFVHLRSLLHRHDLRDWYQLCCCCWTYM